MWYVYIIRSMNFPQQEYIGATADLKRRLPEHNAGKSSHTAKFRLLDEIRIQFVASCGSNLLGTQFNFVQYKSRGNLPGGSTMSVNVLYKTSAKATGGRDGHAATLDGTLDVKLATPKELDGGGGAGNNPEQLFAAGYAACFIGAMKFVASQGGPKVPADASVTSTVGIGPRSAGGFGLEIALDVSLPGVPRADAEALVEKAHQVCPYSNATRGNVDVRLKVL
jgi:Ohr subfamily peroxiredoxin